MQEKSRLKNGIKGIEKNDLTKRQELWALLLISLIIFAVNVMVIGKFYTFTILDDEFGYFGTGAFFSGLNWASVLSSEVYYSYGFGLFLAPLFRIFQDSVSIYRAALLLNCVIACCIVPLSYQTGKRLYPAVNSKFLLLVSFCVSVYPAYIADTKVGWSEILIYFIYWVVVWLFTQVDCKTPCWKFSVLGVLLPYLYMVHQRCLGVVIVGILVILLMKIRKDISVKQLFAFLLPFFVVLLAHLYLKNLVQTQLWGNSGHTVENDFSSQKVKLFSLFTRHGLVSIVLEICGQLFYLGAATFTLAYIGFWKGATECAGFVRGGRPTEQRNRGTYVFIFVALSALATFAISCVFMYFSPNRIDHAIYGRYNETVIGPLLLFGILEAIRHREKFLKLFLAGTAVLAVSGLASLYNIFDRLHLTTINYYCIPAFSWVLPLHMANGHKIVLIYTSSLVIAGIFALLLSHIKGKNVFYRIALILLCILFSITGYDLTRNTILGQNSFQEPQKVVSYVEKKNTNLPVCFLLSKDFDSNIIKDRIQLLMMNKPLNIISTDSLMKDDSAKMLIVHNMTPDTLTAEVYSYLLNHYYVCYTYGGCCVLVPKTSVNKLKPIKEEVYDGKTIYFDSNHENYATYNIAGLSTTETVYTWSDGKDVLFQFSQVDTKSTSLTLKAHIAPFLYKGLSAQTVNVLVNGKNVAEWKVDKDGTYTTAIPVELVRDGSVSLDLNISNPQSPKNAGMSDDGRLLGIRFYEMSIQ